MLSNEVRKAGEQAENAKWPSDLPNIDYDDWADQISALEKALEFEDRVSDALEKRITELEKENGELSKVIDEMEYMATRGTS